MSARRSTRAARVRALAEHIFAARFAGAYAPTEPEAWAARAIEVAEAFEAEWQATHPPRRSRRAKP